MSKALPGNIIIFQTKPDYILTYGAETYFSGIRPESTQGESLAPNVVLTTDQGGVGYLPAVQMTIEYNGEHLLTFIGSVLCRHTVFCWQILDIMFFFYSDLAQQNPIYKLRFLTRTCN